VGGILLIRCLSFLILLHYFYVRVREEAALVIVKVSFHPIQFKNTAVADKTFGVSDTSGHFVFLELKWRVETF
jgi:hypothetical protein